MLIKMCEKLNALFQLYKLFPLCTLSQGGIQDEHKTRYKQDANRLLQKNGKSLEKVGNPYEKSLEKVEKNRKSPLKKLFFTSIITIN